MISVASVVGLLGVSLQLAILGDLITLASLHCYCFYVYAARYHYMIVRFHSVQINIRFGYKYYGQVVWCHLARVAVYAADVWRL